eukprot:3703641-Karenia_brevis.AAC.1
MKKYVFRRLPDSHGVPLETPVIALEPRFDIIDQHLASLHNIVATHTDFLGTISSQVSSLDNLVAITSAPKVFTEKHNLHDLVDPDTYMRIQELRNEVPSQPSQREAADP